MPAVSKDEVVRRVRTSQGLSVAERELLVKPFLPPSRPVSPERGGPTTKTARSKPIRSFLGGQLYLFVYTVIHTLFSVYLRLRRWYHAITDRILSVLYHHHRTPELVRRDLRRLSRIPDHLSVILTAKDDGPAGTALERLMDEAAEMAAWSACAGIPALSIYEKTGVLKGHLPRLHRLISSRLHAYFGRQRPDLQLRAPHVNPFLDGDLVHRDEMLKSSSSSSSSSSSDDLSLLLISAEDGRESMVDLTKTLAEMSQRGKISPADVSLDLIDLELTENVMSEPDLLIVFAPYVELQGYPPWQIRLTEIL